MEVLKAEHLTKVYGSGENEVRALDDVSFYIQRGEFVAIIGPSGSGKSTLLHILGGVDRPTSGRVYLDGIDVYGQNEEQLAIFRRREVGLIYQFYNLIPVLNVVENMTLPVQMDGRKVGEERLQELLKLLNLEDRKNHLPNQLSGGQQQRVSIGRALMNAPAIVLALGGSVCGTWLQHHTPAVVLKYLLLLVLPVVAFITLRTRRWPDEPEPLDPRLRRLIVWAAAFVIGGYDGYYGPGTGTFLMIIFVRFARLDTRHAAGGVKVINLSSNLGSLFTALRAGYVLVGVGLISAVAAILGHYIGAGLAIKNGSKIVKPTVILVLLLLTVKVGSELLFPEFWN